MTQLTDEQTTVLKATQDKYAEVCAKMGDAYYRMQIFSKLVDQYQEELASLNKKFEELRILDTSTETK